VYQILLTRKYLASKIMPLLSAVAVLLCTGMVLIVWSIMGGFLDTLLASGRAMIGDVAIAWPTTGFAYYQDLVRRLEADPAIDAAAPQIETFGMLNLPDGRSEGVQVKGIDGPSYSRVTDYQNLLWWRPLQVPLPKDTGRDDPRLHPTRDWQRLFDDGLHLRKVDPDGHERPAAVIGIEVSGFNERQVGGWYLLRSFGVRREDGGIDWHSGFMPERTITLHVYPINRASGRVSEQVTRVLPVANEFRSGVYETDSRTVFVQLAELQRMLRMDEAVKAPPPAPADRYRIDEPEPAAPATLQVDPARVTHVLVRAAPGVSAADAARRCREIYAQFEQDHRGQVPPPPGQRGGIIVQTWEQRQSTMVMAVQKEIVVMLIILMVISITATFMILSIFWAMISEKTRDIGVLRAIGAGRAGIASLWLGYGLLIGLIGSLLGGLVACLIVWNINPIHDWLTNRLNMPIWDPKVYYFTEIPSRVEPWKAALVLAGGVVFSVLGALIPAVRAARMDPVQSLRFE
jgi:lipoprotein-releasing system permease protein